MNESAKHFWKWFLEHKSKLKNLRQLNSNEQRHYIFWLDWHLQFYFPGLDYILIFSKLPKKKIQFIITASEKQELFDRAIKLEKTAPKLYDWKFTALIKPGESIADIQTEIDKQYILQDITLKTSKIKFISLDYEGGKKTNMIVYLRNFTIYFHNKNLSLLMDIIKQGFLDEKSVKDNITLIQLAQAVEQEYYCIELYDLGFYLDEINILGTQNKNKNQT